VLVALILTTQEQRSGSSQFKVSPRENSSLDPISKKNHKKVLVEWLKVKALSSTPSTEKKKNQ
jgi:hypothetical protein